ncbi:DUF3955 domain-containing protein [Senegalia massiliensis]|uniref:DUF3955 domain-containing protein n=1 Tax=Senegalia massiliensis TaxID=1720316 RepID=A0A845QYY4_9CLOT|nr:DUF3955 domain-containing protein [Senegalia massiliensis]NBI07695.1 DUF3955 domain-containing protein [Senegalia massiliensis]
MKKYLFSIISIIISLGCFIAFKLIGSEILSDGTLSEPFFLIPIGYLFAIIAVISVVIKMIKNHNKKDYGNDKY